MELWNLPLGCCPQTSWGIRVVCEPLVSTCCLGVFISLLALFAMRWGSGGRSGQPSLLRAGLPVLRSLCQLGLWIPMEFCSSSCFIGRDLGAPPRCGAERVSPSSNCWLNLSPQTMWLNLLWISRRYH